jgi:hypothetical protein
MSQVYSVKVDRIGGEAESSWEEVYSFAAAIGVDLSQIGSIIGWCRCCQMLILPCLSYLVPVNSLFL